MTNTSYANDWQANAATGTSHAPRLSAQLIWSAIALLLGAVLLVSFYNVTQQAVAQAHTHWARAIQESNTCASTAGSGCAVNAKSAMEGLVVSQVVQQ